MGIVIGLNGAEGSMSSNLATVAMNTDQTFTNSKGGEGPMSSKLATLAKVFDSEIPTISKIVSAVRSCADMPTYIAEALLINPCDRAEFKSLSESTRVAIKRLFDNLTSQANLNGGLPHIKQTTAAVLRCPVAQLPPFPTRNNLLSQGIECRLFCVLQLAHVLSHFCFRYETEFNFRNVARNADLYQLVMIADIVNCLNDKNADRAEDLKDIRDGTNKLAKLFPRQITPLLEFVEETDFGLLLYKSRQPDTC